MSCEDHPVRVPQWEEIRSLAFVAFVLITCFTVFAYMAIFILAEDWALAVGVWLAGTIAVKITADQYRRNSNE